MAKRSVFVVAFDWSCDGDNGLDIYTFSKRSDALAKFEAIIKDEMNPDISWVGDMAFTELGEVNEDYDLSTNYAKGASTIGSLYWNVVSNCEFDTYSNISLFNSEVK